MYYIILCKYHIQASFEGLDTNYDADSGFFVGPRVFVASPGVALHIVFGPTKTFTISTFMIFVCFLASLKFLYRNQMRFFWDLVLVKFS